MNSMLMFDLLDYFCLILLGCREYYAASRINGIVRGYLDRLLCKELMRLFRATTLIQRVLRGKLGRLKWIREYWRMRSVVRSNTALVVSVGSRCYLLRRCLSVVLAVCYLH